jgi:hypothetical protein
MIKEMPTTDHIAVIATEMMELPHERSSQLAGISQAHHLPCNFFDSPISFRAVSKVSIKIMTSLFSVMKILRTFLQTLYLLKLNNLKTSGKFVALWSRKFYNIEIIIKILRRF